MDQWEIKRHHALDLFFSNVSKLLAEQTWSLDLIEQAEKLSGYCKAYSQVLGIYDISRAAIMFEQWLDEQMLMQLTTLEMPQKIRERIKTSLKIRLMNVTSRASMINNTAILSMPCNIISGQKVFWNSCDVIWRCAGDQSTDFNYYSKRTILASIYNVSRCFYFADESQDFTNTCEFIDSMIEKITDIPRIKENIRSKIKLPKIQDMPIIRLFC